VEALLAQIQDDLLKRTYVPLRARRQEIPKDGGKVRILSMTRNKRVSVVRENRMPRSTWRELET
jgi:hypothetical protein